MMSNRDRTGSIRPATEQDLDAVAATYDAARRFMRANGNQTQWTNGYPSRDDAGRDLAGGWLWVMDSEVTGEVAACMTAMPGPDPTYAVIEGTPWLNDEPYWVLHRLAVAEPGHGLGSRLLAFLCREHDNVRADTHEHNRPMRRALERAGFVRRGTIICADGTPRIAYHYLR